MDVAVEAVLEEITDKMDLFEEKLDKMDAARTACLGKTKMETGQEPREAESKTETKEMEATASEASQEETKAAVVEHRNTSLRTSNRPQDTGTQRKPRTMLYQELLKDGRLVRDDGRSRNSTTT
jgi:hypothetical protein